MANDVDERLSALEKKLNKPCISIPLSFNYQGGEFKHIGGTKYHNEETGEIVRLTCLRHTDGELKFEDDNSSLSKPIFKVEKQLDELADMQDTSPLRKTATEVMWEAAANRRQKIREAVVALIDVRNTENISDYEELKRYRQIISRIEEEGLYG